MASAWLDTLRAGTVIPAHPLALRDNGELDVRRQRALTRYYLDAGAGGIAVGVHTTQFPIREAGLYKTVLELAVNEMPQTSIRVAGIVGRTEQAVREAETAAGLGYHAGLLSLSAFREGTDDEMIAHAAKVGEVMPLFGFYLQPAVGGRLLSVDFWRRFCELKSVIAIKMAPFNRYQTLDVLRGVALSGRADEITLYTGNDDHIVLDLMTEFHLDGQKLRIKGGLLGHYACWTQASAKLYQRIRTGEISAELLTIAEEVTDMNAAIFDVKHNFHGCIAGIHEVLRRQGLLESIRCLDPNETLSPGQAEEITRVSRAYPHLVDDDFVRDGLRRWLVP
jgi:dihydrodipicolinate synthase/N-acetylneuraminate lyase